MALVYHQPTLTFSPWPYRSWQLYALIQLNKRLLRTFQVNFRSLSDDSLNVRYGRIGKNTCELRDYVIIRNCQHITPEIRILKSSRRRFGVYMSPRKLLKSLNILRKLILPGLLFKVVSDCAQCFWLALGVGHYITTLLLGAALFVAEINVLHTSETVQFSTTKTFNSQSLRSFTRCDTSNVN